MPLDFEVTRMESVEPEVVRTVISEFLDYARESLYQLATGGDPVKYANTSERDLLIGQFITSKSDGPD